MAEIGIQRSTAEGLDRVEPSKIVRSKPVEDIRPVNETDYAHLMGEKPHEVKSMFRDMYEFYQNNEV